MVQILYAADQETACLLLPCRRHILSCASLQHSVFVRLPRTAACHWRPTPLPQFITGRQNSWTPRGLLFCPALQGGSYICLLFSTTPCLFLYSKKKKKNLIIRSKEVSQFLLITIQILTSESKIKCFVTFSLCLLSLNALMFWIKEKMEKVYGELHCLRGCKQLSH